MCVGALAAASLAAGRAAAAPHASSRVPHACRSSELRLSRATGTAAAGTSYSWYTLRDVGAARCSLVGYPRVAVLDAHGRVVQHPATHSAHPGTMPPERVALTVLAAGRRAKFVVASTDVTPSPGCPAPYVGRTLEVYPPGQAEPILAPYRGTFCNLVVGPLQPAGVRSS